MTARRPFWPRLAPGAKERALRMIRQRVPIVEICAATGAKEATVRFWACDQQLSLRGLGGPRKGARERAERDRTMVELALSNPAAGNTEIAARFGVSRTRVGQVVDASGAAHLRNRRRGQ